MDGGLELALGLHVANNLYSALVANYTVSALPSESIFTVNVIDPFYGLISLDPSNAGVSICLLSRYSLKIPKSNNRNQLDWNRNHNALMDYLDVKRLSIKTGYKN